MEPELLWTRGCCNSELNDAGRRDTNHKAFFHLNIWLDFFFLNFQNSLLLFFCLFVFHLCTPGNKVYFLIYSCKRDVVFVLESDTNTLTMKTRRRETKLLACLDLVIFLLLSAVSANTVVYEAEVEENAPVGSVVLHFGCECTEWSSHGLQRSLIGENASDFSLSSSAKTGFLLKTTKSLDRELKARYEMYALFPGCALHTVAINIEVLDKNDNPPQFITTRTSIEIDELTAVGSELLRLRARDKDAGRNGAITFTTSPNPYIHVVPKTGQVLLVHSVRAPSTLTVACYARDNGNVVLQSEPLQLHITVTSARLTAKERRGRRVRAVSEELRFTLALSEYAEAGDVIFTVPDQKFEQKRFELLSPEAGSPVRVERDTGRVYLMHRLTSSIQVVVKILNARGKAAPLPPVSMASYIPAGNPAWPDQLPKSRLNWSNL